MSLARIAAKQSPSCSRIRSGKRACRDELEVGPVFLDEEGEIGDAEEAVDS
jgi:hypothetical protein